MIIKGINEKSYLEIKKIGREGLIIKVGNILNNSMELIVDKLRFKEMLKELEDSY